ncbi:hypothetical protein CC1G_02877 [Coprinopsis cinerea okayama7|uniref:HAT C-terminal dimerisation domain-containing protein n=1 Tax=Coprinopsis cinerea (strain Okayama-7 / 130 / ATCC MYA-4618 / FGSC 9003) TaxID=240176 RepID=A8N0A8_COPC7|nr:hypothetical protein CC1G_02877 [Coprinopsis cinerea okayama7\|eukprot:XP_001828296.2 hypothetical protein CC1G_02877 [Coprinopsis cinerea okayama7\
MSEARYSGPSQTPPPVQHPNPSYYYPHPSQWPPLTYAPAHSPPPSSYSPSGSYAYGHYPQQYYPPPSTLHTTPYPSTSTELTATVTAPSAPTTTALAGRKRKQTSSGGSGNKRRRTANSENVSPTASSSSSSIPVAPIPAIPGLGPVASIEGPQSATPPPSPIIPIYGSLVTQTKIKCSKTQMATDVWPFIIPLQSRQPPTSIPELTDTFPLKCPKKAEAQFLGCRFCPLAEMSIWANTHGQTECIRNHLKSKHDFLWREFVIAKKLKGWEKLFQEQVEHAAREKKYPPGSFTIPGFLERLTRWTAVNDQAMNSIECPELRDLLLYVGCGVNLEPSMIPHRTKLTDLLLKRFEEECYKIKQEIQNAKGRISLTSDIWSSSDLTSYMAVTAHYMVEPVDRPGHLELKTRLIAFRHVHGKHDGSHLAKAFVGILDEWGIDRKLCTITLDNASNCNTMMQEVAVILRGRGIAFSAEENRIRCFPHVVNLCVKAGLKRLTSIPMDGVYTPVVPGSDPFINQLVNDDEYYDIEVLDDPVLAARRLANALRASGQRREALAKVIKEGYDSGKWTPEEVPNLVPLKDMEVRWSSTYLMIDRILQLWPAIKVLLSMEEWEDLAHLALSDQQVHALVQIRQFLEIPHTVQESLSAEKTPTLPVALPAYEDLLSVLKQFKRLFPDLREGVQASIDKLDEYFAKSRKTPIYTASMIIHPTIKLEWLEKNWGSEEASGAQERFVNSMLEYRRQMRSNGSKVGACTPTNPGTRLVNVPSASHAARAQNHFRARLQDLKRQLSRSEGSFTSSSSAGASDDDHDDVEQTEEEKRALQEAEDRRAVEEELKAYLEEPGPIGDEAIANFDLVAYWQSKRYIFPTIYRVALDIMSSQASAVPCERVFSSGKETDTMRRAGLSPAMMEVLQILKFNLKSERMSFEDQWVTREEELRVIDIDPDVLVELLAERDFDELTRLISVSYGIPGA